MLHKRGANIEAKCHNGWTAAVGAAYYREYGWWSAVEMQLSARSDMLEVLHELGANLNTAVNTSKWTPLMLAVAANDLKAVRQSCCRALTITMIILQINQLLEKEVRLDHSDAQDRNAEQLALEFGFTEAADAIKAHRESRAEM